MYAVQAPEATPDRYDTRPDQIILYLRNKYRVRLFLTFASIVGWSIEREGQCPGGFCFMDMVE